MISQQPSSRSPQREQETIQRPSLTSESYLPKVLPPVFHTGDFISLFLLNVFWVTNITPIAAGGAAGFVYWLITGFCFFLPCSFVIAQLASMYPYGGGIFTWVYHALGMRWSFFIGLCAWLPGILSIVNAAAAMVSWCQALNGKWLTHTWQQGIAIVVVLGITGVLACQRTRMVQYILNGAAIAMGMVTVLILIAAWYWIATGHPSATHFGSRTNWSIGPSNFALLGSATLALLGSDMPLVLASEIQPPNKRILLSHLTWGTLLTLAGYATFTFAVLIIQGPSVAASTFNPMVLLITTVDTAFGPTMGNIMAVGLGFYFLMIPVALHLCFARLLFVGSVERRLSIWFAQLNRHRVPVNAVSAQILITMIASIFIYFIVPSISFLGKPSDLSSIAYNVIGASLLLVWAFSFLFPFIALGILVRKDCKRFARHALLPRAVLIPVVIASCLGGILLCLAAIGFTLFNSFIPSLIPNGTWWYVIGGSALGCLCLFAICSLFTSSEATWEDMKQAS